MTPDPSRPPPPPAGACQASAPTPAPALLPTFWPPPPQTQPHQQHAQHAAQVHQGGGWLPPPHLQRAPAPTQPQPLAQAGPSGNRTALYRGSGDGGSSDHRGVAEAQQGPQQHDAAPSALSPASLQAGQGQLSSHDVEWMCGLMQALSTSLGRAGAGQQPDAATAFLMGGS